MQFVAAKRKWTVCIRAYTQRDRLRLFYTLTQILPKCLPSAMYWYASLRLAKSKVCLSARNLVDRGATGRL